MDADLRLLAVELINLREEYPGTTKSKILSHLQRYQTQIKESAVEPSSSKRASKTSKQKIEALKHFFGLNVINLWVIMFFLAIYLIYPHARNYKETLNDLKTAFPMSPKNECMIEMPQVLVEFGRPTYDCKLCQSLSTFPTEYNISRMKFLRKYAYNGVPVLIKNAMDDWNALKTFSYKWFQEVYDNVTHSYEAQEYSGQFFPYKTEFLQLEEALHMSEERMNKSWYFGWSNADPTVGAKLRKQYERPFFLPDGGSDSITDWIFMGTPGKGANIHLDNVARPSWQAQIKGKKTWYLVPTPECQDVCHEINATMEPGDIIVVDTNVWYHGTEIWPGNISITIGSEYD